jgi:hypothetical protein
MKEQEQEHEHNLIANQTTTRLIMEGKSGFEIDVALTVSDLTRQVSQCQGVTIRQAKKIVSGLIETNARDYQKASSGE